MDWKRKALGHKFEGPISWGSLLTSVIGSVASSVISRAFSSDDDSPRASYPTPLTYNPNYNYGQASAPAPVTPTPVPVEPSAGEASVAPTADEDAIQRARKQAVYQRLAKSQGRASTILSDEFQSDTLGG